jgi:CRISPR-associated protein Cas2
MFDLPVETSKERRAYRVFRKELIKEGFTMIQYSVYMRICPNREYAKRLTSRVEKIAPHQGHIRLFMITEKQYEDMNIIIGNKTNTEKIMGIERLIKI